MIKRRGERGTLYPPHTVDVFSLFHLNLLKSYLRDTLLGIAHYFHSQANNVKVN
jgi:hypothetical protein